MLFLNFSLCTEIRRQPLCEIFHLLESVLVMMFGQFSNRESLRGLIVALEAHQGKRYHLGLGREPIAKTTLASANQNRDYRNVLPISWIFQEESMRLILLRFLYVWLHFLGQSFVKKNILSKELFDGP